MRLLLLDFPNGKENGNYRDYRDSTGVIQGFRLWGFRVLGLGLRP